MVSHRRWPAVLASLSILVPLAVTDSPATAATKVSQETPPTGPTRSAAQQEAGGDDRSACSSVGFAGQAPSAASADRARTLLDSAPSVVQPRLIRQPFTGFSSNPALRIQLLTETGEIMQPAIESAGLAHASSPTMEAAISSNDAAVQVVAATDRVGGVASLTIEHTLSCPGADELEVRLVGEGAAISAILDDGERRSVASVAKPWAVDAQGKELRTWFEVHGTSLRQLVDTTGAVAPVVFDPTYSFLPCNNGYYSDLVAYWYLNINANDIDYCPVMGMFTARNGYRPVFAFETNVANDYGKILVKQDGGCSSSPDTGPSFDFQVPCKAHDYCYDLRKAGFSGTVSDNDCDDLFYWLMEAHCNDRVLADQCRAVRTTYWLAVSAPGVVTNPDPAALEIINSNSAQCLDVEGSSQADNARVLQYTCFGTANQKWKVTPAAGEPGLFRLAATHSQKCADAIFTDITQWTCVYAEQVVQIRGAFNANVYTIRPKSTSFAQCFDIPFSSTTPGERVIRYSCYETDNQLWFIN